MQDFLWLAREKEVNSMYTHEITKKKTYMLGGIKGWLVDQSLEQLEHQKNIEGNGA